MNYLESLAEMIKPLLPEDAQNLGKSAYLELAALCRIKGAETTNSDVHDIWSVWATMYVPEHKCLQPYEMLAPEDQEKDTPFSEAVRTVAKMKEEQ